MGGAHGEAGRHPIAFRDLLLYGVVQVGEGGAVGGDQPLEGLGAGYVWARGVVGHVIVGEDSAGDIEVALVEDLLCRAFEEVFNEGTGDILFPLSLGRTLGGEPELAPYRSSSVAALSGGPRPAEELLVVVAELGAHVFEFAPRHRRLQDRGHRPSVLDGLVGADALSLRHPPVKLLHGKGLSAPLPFHEPGDLRRELGGGLNR